jgi:hypothetical protein
VTPVAGSVLRKFTYARRSIDLAGIDERTAMLSENLRELVEQATAYSGAADEELTAQRIAEQEEQLETLTKQRDELFRQESRDRSATFIASNDRARRNEMGDNRVKKNMEVIGADGVHVGTVDRIENGKIRLTKADSGEGRHKGHHHFIDLGLVADVEGRKVRLSANAAVAVTLGEEQSGESI